MLARAASAALLVAKMDQQIDSPCRCERAPIQVLFNQKGTKMREIVIIGVCGVGRTTRRFQIRNEQCRHLAERRRLQQRTCGMIFTHIAFSTRFESFINITSLASSGKSVYIMLERFFGPTLTISTGRVVPVRFVGEQHVREDLGFIPSFGDWVRCIRPEPWMGRAQPIHRDVDPFAAEG